MRSPDPRAALFALACALSFSAAATPVLQSGIPRSINGTVERVDIRFEKRPGSDDVYLVSVGGRRLILDRAVARHLEVGDRVQKRPWSRTIRVDGERFPITPSREAMGVVAAAPVPAIVVGLFVGRGRLAIGRRRAPRLERERRDVGTERLAEPAG